MIGRLKGELVELEGGVALVDAGGVGYEVSIPDSVALRLPPPGSEVTLYTRQVFREDGVSLYGFQEPFQRRLFDMLTEVKGCGPKIGLALIGQIGEDAVVGAISAQDVRSLSCATGVGPKLAERIALELRDKVAEFAFQRRFTTGAAVTRIREDEVVEALLALGYRRQEAETAAQNAEGGGSVEERLKSALRSLKR